ELGDDALLSCALATSAATDFFFRGCALDEQKLERALLLEDPDLPSSIERRPSFVVGWMLLHSEQFDRARRIMKALHEHIVERGAESDLPELISVQARLECLVGNLEEAAALADYGFEVARQSGSDSSAASVRGIRALIDAHAGRVEETRVAAAEAI